MCFYLNFYCPQNYKGFILRQTCDKKEREYIILLLFLDLSNKLKFSVKNKTPYSER